MVILVELALQHTFLLIVDFAGSVVHNVELVLLEAIVLMMDIIQMMAAHLVNF